MAICPQCDGCGEHVTVDFHRVFADNDGGSMAVGFFPYFARVRENDVIQTALTGVNAAVVGAILGATVTLAAESFVNAFTVVLAVVTFGLFVRGTHAAYLILGDGGSGIAWYFLIL